MILLVDLGLVDLELRLTSSGYLISLLHGTQSHPPNQYNPDSTATLPFRLQRLTIQANSHLPPFLLSTLLPSSATQLSIEFSVPPIPFLSALLTCASALTTLHLSRVLVPSTSLVPFVESCTSLQSLVTESWIEFDWFRYITVPLKLWIMWSNAGEWERNLLCAVELLEKDTPHLALGRLGKLVVFVDWSYSRTSDSKIGRLRERLVLICKKRGIALAWRFEDSWSWPVVGEI